MVTEHGVKSYESQFVSHSDLVETAFHDCLPGLLGKPHRRLVRQYLIKPSRAKLVANRGVARSEPEAK